MSVQAFLIRIHLLSYEHQTISLSNITLLVEIIPLCLKITFLFFCFKYFFLRKRGWRVLGNKQLLARPQQLQLCSIQNVYNTYTRIGRFMYMYILQLQSKRQSPYQVQFLLVLCRFYFTLFIHTKDDFTGYSDSAYKVTM